MSRRHVAVAAMMLCAGSALAQVNVIAPWVRATVPSQKNTGAYLHVQSHAAARLVGVSSPLASSAQLHQMSMDGASMKMRAVDGIELPAGKDVDMSSGQYHIMLVGLKRQLKAGEAIPLTLVVQGQDNKRDTITLKVPVKPIGFVSSTGTPTPHH